MDDASKGVEIWGLCFSCSWIALLCSQFFLQLSLWRMESFKIFLYTIFSFIISLVILFAKLWQHSRSLRYKAHAAYLALTITSVYSFFFDKVMNGKPDAYNIISCAAFSIMSLSLSRQTQCGFEVDLLYFFLEVLIVQLMKIKLQLFIVGAGFSYSLIILRSYFLSTDVPQENEYVDSEEHPVVIIEVNSLQFSSMMQQLMTCVKALEQNDSNLIDRLSELVRKYKKDLNRFGAGDNYELVDFPIDALPAVSINDLHDTAKLMVGAGYEKEYVDMIIGRWKTASMVVVDVLFRLERRLSDHVFSDFSSSTADHCFEDVCQGVTIQLLNFADAVADGHPSTWRLFKMVEVFGTLVSLIPKLQSLFSDSFVKEAVSVKQRLGEASRDLLMEMNNLIFRLPETKQVASDDGQHHPMTVQVITTVTTACRFLSTLRMILKNHPKVVNGVETFFSLEAQMSQIMNLLIRKLTTKSKNYKDPALCYLFMMNNRSHMEAMNKALGFDFLFSYNWSEENIAKIKQDLEGYQRSSWNKVLNFLKLDNNDNVTTVSESELLKEKLHLFNMQFEEICRVQSTWFVYDKTLRKEIITSIGNNLLPAYGIFIGRLQDILGNHAYKYIGYGIFEIQDRLNHLFMADI